MHEQIDGSVEPGYEGVRDEFAANFGERAEVGAAVCVYADGRPVVDLWGGTADPATGRPWERDTVVLVFSATKGVTATCAHLCVERGLLDLDAPVAAYWPEFAANGKGTIPVRWVLSHQAGLAVVEADVTLEEALAWEPVVRALAAQPTGWEPGTAHGYHLRSYGWLVGEIVRRVTGQTLGTFLAREVAGPLGLDFWIGLPAEVEPRVAAIVPPRSDLGDLLAMLPDDVMLGPATTGPSGHFHYDEMWNTRAVRAAELPSSNGIGDARSLARMYAALIGEVDGRRLLSPATVEVATRPQVRGTDAVLMVETCFGLGFMLPPSLGAACGRSAFGHAGAGGSLAFADPDAGFSFAYVMNDMRFDLVGDPRSESLVAATYRARGA